MAWETRGGRRYYYSAERIGGRVVKRYVGRGELADLIAQSEAIRHEMRQETWEDRRHLAKVLRNVGEDEEHRQTLALARLWLESLGYHRPGRGKWRKKRVSKDIERGNPSGNLVKAPTAGQVGTMEKVETTEQAPVLPTHKERLDAISAGAASKATPEQRALALRVIQGHPEELGQILTDAFRPWRMEGGDIQAAVRVANLETLARELAGPNPPPIVLALARRVAVDQMQLADAEANQQSKLGPGKSTTLALATYLDKAISQAHKRYLASLKTLAQVKRLTLPQVNVALPGSVQVNQGVNQLNVSKEDAGT